MLLESDGTMQSIFHVPQVEEAGFMVAMFGRTKGGLEPLGFFTLPWDYLLHSQQLCRCAFHGEVLFLRGTECPSIGRHVRDCEAGGLGCRLVSRLLVEHKQPGQDLCPMKTSLWRDHHWTPANSSMTT